jgi:hypothetical protein
MAEPEVENVGDELRGDVEMAEDNTAGVTVVEESTFDTSVETQAHVSFLDYLKSPMVEVHIGSTSPTILTAHQAILVKSPYLKEACDTFPANSAGSDRRIDLPDDDIHAVGSVLEYLYNGEYFPRRIDPTSKNSSLEADDTIPSPDEHGVGLLRHARVYTLADKLRLPKLKSLAHSKIHNTASTAKGEIVYARYVYAETSEGDEIRKPVAAFWAQRSHLLRHEAEGEFRTMCLDFPQFGFEVLSLVLDRMEKGKGGAAAVRDDAGASSGRGQSTPHTGRKRQRNI